MGKKWRKAWCSAALKVVKDFRFPSPKRERLKQKPINKIIYASGSKKRPSSMSVFLKIYRVGEARNLLANKITITNANAIMANPDTP